MLRPLSSLCVVATLLVVSCRYPATQVFVQLDTDVPADRVLTVRAFVREGGAMAGASDSAQTIWTRVVGGGATQPVSFAVVPRPEGARDGDVTLVLDAEIAGRAPGERSRSLRRVARFRFTPQQATRLPIFLAFSCTNVTAGCTRVDPADCTVSASCEERNQTCGDNGECVRPEVVPILTEAGLPGRDVARSDVMDVPPPRDSPSMIDVPSPPDVIDIIDGGDAPMVDPAPPELIAPMSTSVVTSQMPLFRWRNAAGSDGARIEVCAERDCTTVLISAGFRGESGTYPVMIPAGVSFWRVRGYAGEILGTRTSPVWQLTIPSRNAPVNATGGSVMDVNGDGASDVVIGALATSSRRGAAYVHLGGPSGLTAAPSSVVQGRAGMLDDFGCSVASAGDVNGDGFGDVIVGAMASTMISPGAAFIFHGGVRGLDATPTTTLLGPDDVGGRFGQSVASAGDFNRDGYGDIVIGAPLTGMSTGRAYLYFGGPRGITAASIQAITGPDGPPYRFGHAVAGLGDVDGDGFADIAISAADRDRVYVYYGAAAPRSTRPPTMLTQSEAGFGQFGISAAGAGDVNGDGYFDLIAGAWAVNSNTGRAYVFLGGPTAIATIPQRTLIGPSGTQGYFGASVAGNADIDGDGFADVIVGAPGTNTDTGRAFMYRGGAAGVSASPSTSLNGIQASSQFGRGVAISNTDGDQFAEVIVGAPRAASYAGRAYVWRGPAIGTTPSVVLSPPAAASGGEYGGAVASLGNWWLTRITAL